MITDAVDAFTGNLGANLKDEIVWRKPKNAKKIAVVPRDMNRNRRGKTSQEGATRIITLPSIETADAFFSCYTQSSEKSRLSPAEYHAKTTDLAHGTTEQRLNKKSGKQTLYFQTPVARQF